MPHPVSSSAELDALFADFRPDDWPLIACSNQGTLVRVQYKHFDLAVKSPMGRSLLWYGRQFALKRELAAYQRLESVDGFPRCFGLFSGRYLALEYIDGQLLRGAELADGERYFDQLKSTITAMHRRGVVHGDLKSRTNVMVDSSGKPLIIDLGTAVVRKPGWRPLNRYVFNYLKRIDRNGYIKLKYGGYEQVAEEDLDWLERSLIERLNRRFRRRGR